MVLDMQFDKLNVGLSPDGRLVAYASNESGSHQIFVQTFPDGAGGRWQITSDGGVEPQWRRDGRELYFLAPDGKLMAVPVSAGTAFTAGRPARAVSDAVDRQPCAARPRCALRRGA